MPDSWGLAIVELCIFDDNHAPSIGGAVLCGTAHAEFVNCTFSNNSSGQAGGAVYWDFSTYWHPDYRHLLNCTFYNNSSPSGGAVYCLAPINVTRTIIASSQQGEGMCCDGAVADWQLPHIACSDIYGNLGGDWVGGIAAQDTSAGNLSADPQFCNPGARDFHLEVTSPCAPGGSECGLIGAWQVGCLE